MAIGEEAGAPAEKAENAEATPVQETPPSEEKKPEETPVDAAGAVVRVAVDDPGVVRDIDTPADLARG